MGNLLKTVDSAGVTGTWMLNLFLGISVICVTT